MPLKIEVLKYRGDALTEPLSAVFDRDGGTVGRSADNRLVLADDCVSRKHARISFQSGRYYLTDESANGTLISNRDLLVHYDRVELEDGDILRIGDYELEVIYVERVRNTHAVGVDQIPPKYRIEEDRDRDRPSDTASPPPPPPPPRRDGPSLFVKELSIDDFFKDTDDVVPTPDRDTDSKLPADPQPRRQATDVLLNERKVDSLFKDIDDFFKDTAEDEGKAQAPIHEKESEKRTFEKPRIEGLPPIQTGDRAERFEELRTEQPRITEPDLPIPELPEPELPAPVVVASVVPSPVAPAPVVDAGGVPESGPGVQEIQAELFRLFLKGARIEETGFTPEEIPELMESLGAVFRELATGLYTVLRGRSELKAEFRLAMTMVRPFCNNPLKLSPRIEDALKRLMKRDHPSFLEPVDAVREGFADIMNHQLAMNAGVQASMAEALDKFDPQRFAEKHKDASMFQTKGKCWKDYCDAYGDLREQAAEGVFGKAFVQAYEEQLEKLRARQKKNCSGE